MRNILFLLLIVLLIVSCKKDNNDASQSDGSLKGVILNELNQPIKGAIVGIESITTTSDSIGAYSFNKLDAKKYLVSVTKKPYLDLEKSVLIKGEETARLDFVLSTEGSFLQLSDSVLALNTGSGSATLHIESNTEWRIENPPDWLSFSVLEGFGNFNLEISYSENTMNLSRIDTITVTTSNISQSLIIIQYPVLELLLYEWINGNELNEIVDSIYILFNRPITVESIMAKPNYVPPISYAYSENKHGFRFDYIAAITGRSDPFIISVTDDEGNSFNEEINIPFYHKKLEIEGEITDYLYLNQDKEMLIAVFNPSQLIHYSLETQSIIQTIDLSSYLAPVKLSYNPYNSLIYMMGSYANGEMNNPPIDRPDVYTLDMQTNQIKLAFTIQPDGNKHQKTPAIYPQNIGFTSSGYGVVLLSSTTTTEMKIKLIDSSNNDSIYDYPDEKLKGIKFMNLHMNYDFTKLYLIKPYARDEYGVFDATTQRISYIDQNSGETTNFITPNRQKECLYAGQGYNQYILDLNDNKSEKTHFSFGPHQASGDFSYAPGKENCVYFCNGDELFFCGL